jgi:hypothetical protein
VVSVRTASDRGDQAHPAGGRGAPSCSKDTTRRRAGKARPKVGLRVFPGAREWTAWVLVDADPAAEPPTKAQRGTVLSAEHRARAARRSKAEARRYATANRCGFLHTLTFAGRPGAVCDVTGAPVVGDGQARHLDGPGLCGCGRPLGADGFDAAMAAGERFVRRLRHARRGKAYAYLLVGEQHKDGHWHVHIALPFQVPAARLRRLWGSGRVDDGFSEKDRARFRSFEDQAAAAGSYCGKYLAKSLEVLGEQAVGRQTYRVAEGFQPREVVLRLRDEHEARAVAGRLCGGGEVVAFWDSAEVDDWQGPRTWWARHAWRGPPEGVDEDGQRMDLAGAAAG